MYGYEMWRNVRRVTRYHFMSDPSETFCQARRQQSVHASLVRELKERREFSTSMGEFNTVQSGRSGVLAAGSESLQFFHKHFGDNAVQKLEGSQRGKK